MESRLKAALVIAAGFTGASLLVGSGGVAEASAASGIAVPAADTAVVRLHISKMTCGTCPTTARVALKKLAGVYDAKVTLDDSLGVVRYDPHRVTPEQITAHLTRLTGYPARVLADTVKAPAKPESR